jgi:hypothetical protein
MHVETIIRRFNFGKSVEHHQCQSFDKHIFFRLWLKDSIMEASEVVYSWAVEYAKSGRSSCQATHEKIEEGAVRIGKEVDNPYKSGTKMFLWYKPEALFAQFRKGSESKPRIKAVGEIAGFAGLRAADAAALRAMVEAELAFRAGLQAVEADAETFDHPEGKFWSIVAAGSTTRVRWGKAGEEGQLSEKSHADEDAARKFVEKMVSLETPF